MVRDTVFWEPLNPADTIRIIDPIAPLVVSQPQHFVVQKSRDSDGATKYDITDCICPFCENDHKQKIIDDAIFADRTDGRDLLEQIDWDD